jgi:hypothetical protein
VRDTPRRTHLGKPIAITRGVTYVRSRSNPPSWKRFFFLLTRDRITEAIAAWREEGSRALPPLA